MVNKCEEGGGRGAARSGGRAREGAGAGGGRGNKMMRKQKTRWRYIELCSL